MKKLTALLILSLAPLMAQSQDLPDTTAGYYVFAGIKAVDSVLVNEQQMSFAFDPDNQRLARYVEQKVTAFDTNKVYRVARGTYVVKVDHLHRPYATDQNGKKVYKDCGRTIFLMSRDAKMIVVLYVGLGGWYETYFYRQPSATHAPEGAYAAKTDRPIDCVIKDPDQKSLRALLTELFEYEEEKPPPNK